MIGGDVGNALTRKFGPLPAWGWLGIGGGALFYYNRLKGGQTPAAKDPSITDAKPLQDPVTLQPGERIYDPNTGQLIGGDLPPPPAPPPPPGRVPAPTSPPRRRRGGGGVGFLGPPIHPPGGGAIVGTGTGGAGGGGGPGFLGPPVVRFPTFGISVPRLWAVILEGVRKKPSSTPEPESSIDREPSPIPQAPERGRATPPVRVALRQRPVPPRVQSPTRQKSVAHPGRQVKV